MLSQEFQSNQNEIIKTKNFGYISISPLMLLND